MPQYKPPREDPALRWCSELTYSDALDAISHVGREIERVRTAGKEPELLAQLGREREALHAHRKQLEEDDRRAKVRAVIQEGLGK